MIKSSKNLIFLFVFQITFTYKNLVGQYGVLWYGMV